VNFEHLFSPLQVGPDARAQPHLRNHQHHQFVDDAGPDRRALHRAPRREGQGRHRLDRQRNLAAATPVPAGGAPTEIGLAVGCAGTHWAAYQNPAFAESMAKFCEEVHKSGSVAVVQLTHLSAVWAPSPVPVIGAQDYTPHVMGEAEIEFCLNTYADAPRRSRKELRRRRHRDPLRARDARFTASCRR
jgi:hypothetical protein